LGAAGSGLGATVGIEGTPETSGAPRSDSAPGSRAINAALFSFTMLAADGNHDRVLASR
jgi:hypothetical protein